MQHEYGYSIALKGPTMGQSEDEAELRTQNVIERLEELVRRNLPSWAKVRDERTTGIPTGANGPFEITRHLCVVISAESTAQGEERQTACRLQLQDVAYPILQQFGLFVNDITVRPNLNEDEMAERFRRQVRGNHEPG